MNKLIFLSIFFCAAGFAQAAELQTITVTHRPTTLTRTLYGRIEASQRATVSAQTSGRVVEINVDIGDYVKKNSVLIRLRSTNQQTRLNAASARYKKAVADFARARSLYARKLFSKAMLDKAAADLKSAQSGYNQAKEELERTVIRAPYSGILVKRHIQVGETARVGQPLLTGLSLEALRVRVEIPQDMLQAVKRYNRATILLRDRTLKLSRLSLSPYADPKSHSFTLKADLPAADTGLYPGMFVKVRFKTGTVRRLLVPRRAIVHRGEVTAVYTLDGDTLHMRQVRTGSLLPPAQVEILSGLRDGDRVALDPVKATLLLKKNR